MVNIKREKGAKSPFSQIRKEILLLKKLIITILIGILVIGSIVAAVILVNRNREQDGNHKKYR